MNGLHFTPGQEVVIKSLTETVDGCKTETVEGVYHSCNSKGVFVEMIDGDKLILCHVPFSAVYIRLANNQLKIAGDDNKRLAKKEMEMAISMLDGYSDYLSVQVCNDYEFPSNWSDEEKTKFTKDYHEWNGDPEEYKYGDILNCDFAAALFLAFKLGNNIKEGKV